MASKDIWQSMLGFPFFVHCTQANVSDDQGLIEMVTHNIDYFKERPELTTALEQMYPQIMSKIQFELAPKPIKAQKQEQGKTGFVVVATRWVVEHSNAWMERCKSLVKNFERTLDNATAKANLCFIRLMLKRLAVN
ncbi:IS5/IS1182 family transposase [Leptolyngbyaceae cyanobacterium UHCC 1019]